MNIYTRKGDTGKTSLIGASVHKDHIRVEAYGTVDELNSVVGQAIVTLNEKEDRDIIEDLSRIQHELFDIGGDLANVQENANFQTEEAYIDHLEKRIDEYWSQAPSINAFILPGGDKTSAALHQCRTVCRRAERRVASLMDEEALHPPILKYLNRLSDLFFASARAINARRGIEDVTYQPGK
ncbi:cob(I)yrinic acid a,c-diamide adenosyltransferase [Texcoconibacillus texcoconensis]|uniref:Corrinoid adenosyltransferase n=1 Tax=Texcoconibacillus texcoconensis TaxID=1095777 RepID=A0A840QNM6_9BACI|nr:cob(I)yrinic acid a,c-diamide adenosyltransferase [Texcoconibacillus texcoconensis]MBB5172941.1 cob(I)alamin adenosyltransferase [Texcoconibacillus texcoconensis]